MATSSYKKSLEDKNDNCFILDHELRIQAIGGQDLESFHLQSYDLSTSTKEKNNFWCVNKHTF